jgi:hypothetical protein
MTIRVLVPLVAAALPLCAFPGSATAQTPENASVHVRIIAVVKDEVSGLAWVDMKAECERIWRAEGVSISWDNTPAIGGSLPEVQVPLVVDDVELRKRGGKAHADAFGLTVFSGRTHRVVVSIPRIRDLVSSRRGLTRSDDSTVFDAAVGRIFGRVVAHELGHVLLRSTWHAPTGLMSASLGTQHLGPFDPVLDRLAAPDRTRLAILFANAGPGERRADAPPSVLARGTGPGEGVVAGGGAVVPITLSRRP